jgi:chorismate synthase
MTHSDTEFLIRELASLADYDACVALQDDTWGQGFSERVPGAILRVAQKIGGVAAGAFDRAGGLAGFVFGMTGVRDGLLVHWSDMLAVRPVARGTGLAERLKQYQRERVRDLGVSIMYWTADPLVARNAHFNINHLGAQPSEYVENMYGGNTGSVLHGAMPTDRFVYRWELDAPPVQTRGDATHTLGVDVRDAIEIEADGTPHAVGTGVAQVVRIPLPDDLSAVQSASSTLALAWRMAVRESFTTRLSHGFSVTRFVRGSDAAPSYYVLSASD